MTLSRARAPAQAPAPAHQCLAHARVWQSNCGYMLHAQVGLPKNAHNPAIAIWHATTSTCNPRDKSDHGEPSCRLARMTRTDCGMDVSRMKMPAASVSSKLPFSPRPCALARCLAPLSLASMASRTASCNCNPLESGKKKPIL